MLYKILNKIVESKIEKTRPLFIKFLLEDLEGAGAEASAERLTVERKYILLVNYFSNDYKRKYMINKNYLAFIRAVVFLYQTSPVSSRADVLMAPSEVYNTINSVRDSFNEITTSLGLEEKGKERGLGTL